jgi:tRNA (guanosine-2'-O-)-methyltransferase
MIQIMEKSKKNLIDFLYKQVSPEIKNKLEVVIQNRTRYITIVVEDLYQSQNASSVTRTCENSGIQDIYAIEDRNNFIIDENVSLRAEKWVDIFRYNNTPKCIEKLKADGYRIIATTPHKNDFNLEELPIDNKIAIIFGTEEKGLSDDAINSADQFMKIPMFGFTESFNISVSTAITACYLTNKLRDSKINWKLTEEESQDLKLNFLKKLIDNFDSLEHDFHML